MSWLFRPPFTRLVRQLLGNRYYAPLRELYLCYRDSGTDWRDSRWANSVERIRTYSNRHSGERCFILGNGPSLKKTDLSLLENEITFGLNRIYLLFDELGFSTTYYVAINRLVIEQCAQDIAGLSCPKFISWRNRNLLDFTSNTMFLNDEGEPGFRADITRKIWQGATVTYIALQIAYYMGFRQVILLGVDHFFKSEGKPHTEITSQGDDLDHFSPEYFGKGFRWQLPDLETSELAYRMAKYQFELNSREVVDATIEGNLRIFPKVDYNQLFK